MTALLGYDCTGTFSVALSVTGVAPATHFGASAQVTLSDRNKMLAVFAQGNVEGRRGWRGEALVVDAFDIIRLHPGDALPQDTSRARWTFARCLAESGLQVVFASAPILQEKEAFMSLVISCDNTAKNAGLDAELTLANGKVVNVYTAGSGVPASGSVALTDQILLFSGAMNATAFAAAVAGVATANAMTGGTAVATGTAAFWRIVSTGTLGRFQGLVALSGSSMTLNRIAIIIGDVITINSCVFTRS